MNINSNAETNNQVKYEQWQAVQVLVSWITSSMIILMSLDYMETNLIYMITGLIIITVTYNVTLTYSSKEQLQSIEDNAISYILKDKPIIGPIGIFLTFFLFGLLITGNMVGWYIYILYIIVVTMIGKAHKTRLGVVNKKDQ